VALTEEQKQSRAETRQRNEALRAEADALRHEAKRREWHEKGMYLTREQAAAGEPCRGCGLPVIDNLGSWPPLMRLSPEERTEYDTAEARFKHLHPECHAHRWSMQGSRATHCGLCCPPVPLAQSQIESISRILSGHVRREEELDVWVLNLTCGHSVERSVHHTQRYWVGSTTHCPHCDVTRGIVTSERIVEAADRIAEMQRKRTSDIARAKKEVARTESAAAEARQRLAALKSER
jgi:hypothetical protein